MMKSKKKIFITLFIVLISVCAVIICIKKSTISVEEDLYSLKSTISQNELKQMGYIDTSNIHKSENEKIKEFLRCTKIYQKAIIKTFQIKEGELYVKVYYSDPKLKEIRLWTFSPWNQKAIAPDKRFSNAYNDEKNKIVTVILVNKKNDSLPTDNQILKDEILYSYCK